MSKHKFSHISSLGGNEISCIVGDKVLEISSRPELLKNVTDVSSYFAECLRDFENQYADTFCGVSHFGCILSLGVNDRTLAKDLYTALFQHGVLCHSISEISPASIKFLPPLVLSKEQVDEIMQSLNNALIQVFG